MADSLETDLKQDDVQVEQASEVLDKATVSKIVERERMKAYEKGKREAMDAQQQSAQVQQPAPEQAPQQQQQMQQSGMAPEDIQRMIAEQLPQHMQNHIQQVQNKQAIESFVNKMQAAEARYPGIEQKLNDLDYESLTPVVMMANNLDNTADVMAELVDNPSKMANLMTLMYTQPKLAQREMANLSNSIKTNQAAIAQEKSAQKPIGQTKSSVNSGIDDHNLSIQDLRKMFRN